MSGEIFIGTRKGLFKYERIGGAWHQTYVAFLGVPVTAVLTDPRSGYWYAALSHGHFGAKLQRSTNRGATWEELPMPAFAKTGEEAAPSVNQIWTLETGGAAQTGVIWAGTLPAALFRNEDHGAGSWRISESLWEMPERKQWFGGGTDEPVLHTICVDPRDANRIVVAVSCGGVWRSEDAGKSWANRSKGMRADYMPPQRAEDENIQDAHRVVQCRGRPDHFWCQHHNGIFFSRNDLASWESAGPRFGFGVAVHPRDPAKAWFVPAAKDELRVPADGRFVASRTRDGGKSFEELADGLPLTPSYDLVLRHALDIDATGDMLAFGSTTGNLYVSADQGDKWLAVTNHLPPIYVVRFAAI